MGPLPLLSSRIERRDSYTRGHSTRVTTIARALAERLHCGADELAAIALGGPLHDIGKLTIPDEVLLKPGRLDEDELRRIREHPAAGAWMLRGVRALDPAVPCVLHHHERWDGAGYPHGLAGSGIPLVARILAVADAWDAMTTTRPYRIALSAEIALDELVHCAGTQFDPDAADAFLAAWHAGEIPAP